MSEQKKYLLPDNKLLKIVNMILKDATSEEMQQLFNTNSVMYHKKLNDKYQEFSLTYPGLFNTIADNPKSFDIRRLVQMLEMKKRITNQEITQEEASTKIGQQYYDEFAKPLVDKIDNKSS